MSAENATILVSGKEGISMKLKLGDAAFHCVNYAIMIFLVLVTAYPMYYVIICLLYTSVEVGCAVSPIASHN